MRPVRHSSSGWQKLASFLFPEATDSWVTVLRLGLGLQLVTYCLSLRQDWLQMLSATGHSLINRNMTEAILNLEIPFVPRAGWLVSVGSWLGLEEATVLSACWWGLLAAGTLLVLGLFCRVSAIAAWLLYLAMAKSGDWLIYGVDTFTISALFYLMLAPLPDRMTLDWLLHPNANRRENFLGFFQRVLQLHLCVTYFFGGLSKCLGAGWWNGESIWRALTSPPYNRLPPELVLSGNNLLPFLGITVCVLETAYPIFIWPKRTRPYWLIGIIGMHVAIGVSMGLYLFAFIMITLNLAAFGPSALPRLLGRPRPEAV